VDSARLVISSQGQSAIVTKSEQRKKDRSMAVVVGAACSHGGILARGLGGYRNHWKSFLVGFLPWLKVPTIINL